MSMLVPRKRNYGMQLWDDDFFNHFFNMGDMFGSTGFRVDVREQPDKYMLEADLPGVQPEEIDVSVDNGVLTIAANMHAEKKQEQENYIYSERRAGTFQRSFRLDNVKEEGIKASYKDGVLHLELPKKEAQKVESKRRIPIE